MDPGGTRRQGGCASPEAHAGVKQTRSQKVEKGAEVGRVAKARFIIVVVIIIIIIISIVIIIILVIINIIVIII